MLDVPAHTTGRAVTKPVDRVVGEAIAAWDQVRPAQPSHLDATTGEVVIDLLAYRGMQMGLNDLNHVVIPLSCRTAGIPESDARGRITSYRTRPTIASQLFNAKEPRSLLEPQAWLGHRSPDSTQHDVGITPTRLAKAYTDAAYFGRTVRMIEVLVDREAITGGAAAAGQPGTFDDPGHGYCSDELFAQCPHRMACARCGFDVSKDSGRAQLSEGKGHLRRRLQEIPLSESERAAIADGLDARARLLGHLADVSLPAGPTPRQLHPRGIQERPVILQPRRRRQTTDSPSPTEGDEDD